MKGARAHISATAWHEAGHALAAMREGRSVSEGQVLHSAPGSGFVRFSRFQRDYRFSPLKNRGTAKAAWLLTQQRKLAEVRVLLAGPLAEAKKLGKPLRSLGAESDLRKCRDIASSLAHLSDYFHAQANVPVIDPHELLNQQRDQVRRWLGRREIWAAIDRIAQTLEERGSIDGGLVLQAYLEAGNQKQQTLGLNWRKSD